MTITLTVNYKEIFATETVEKIDELIDDSYALDDILEFIDANTEADFVAYYEEYCSCGEDIGYEAVDAFIKEMGCISYVEDCDEKYRGCYESAADFTEEYYSEQYDIPSALVIDWEGTWDSMLRYDFTACESSYRQVHIFSDY